MSTTLHYSLVGEPELLDILDEDWLRDTLPDDGALLSRPPSARTLLLWHGAVACCFTWLTGR